MGCLRLVLGFFAGAIVGGVLAIVLGEWIGELLGISTFEGGRGYFVVFLLVPFFAIVVGVLATLLTAVLWRNR